jgi:hypothetical protein
MKPMKRTFTFIFMLCIICLSTTTKAQEVKINSNLVVEADGTMRMDGAATVFNDLNVFPDATTKSGSNQPTMSKFQGNGGSQGVFLWMFASETEQELYFTIQLPHSYKVGTPIFPHVHWTAPGGGLVALSGSPQGTNVVWGLEYTIMKVGGVFGSTTIITSNNVIPAITTLSAGGGINQHLITYFAPIDGSAFEISTVLVCRLFRQVSNTSDTYNNSIGLLGMDFHYESDTQGSRTEYTK